MIVPKEKPHFFELNSYYIVLDKFVEFLQHDLGSGCISCRAMSAAAQDLMIFFNEYEIIQCVMFERQVCNNSSVPFTTLTAAFNKQPFLVSVYKMELNAVYFWAKIPAYTRESQEVDIVTASAFSELVKRYKTEDFSGFLDIHINKEHEENGGLLFFNSGELIGGSYSWGGGGLSPWDTDYRRLLTKLDAYGGGLKIGSFMKTPALAEG